MGKIPFIMNTNRYADSSMNSYRPWPFLVFNEEHEGVLGEARITDMLEGFKRVGFGGAYLHARPGMITEYLSPRWFALIRYAIQECRRLGLIPALYDENSYPSGFAGGHVVSRAPDTRARYVIPRRGRGPASIPNDCIVLLTWERSRPGAAIKLEEVQSQDEWLAFTMEDFPNLPFLAGNSYVSLTDPQIAELFLEATHDRYRQELSDRDWASLGSIFTDEPHLPGAGLGAWSPGLHCTPYILSQFETEYGYDLRTHLAALYYDMPGSSGVRYDFYDLIHRLWVKNWAQPLKQWHNKKKIPLTGHYLEHDWPAPYATPGQMHMLAYMDWPGTDLLGGYQLLGHDFYDPQNFEGTSPGREPHALYYLKQASSVANQLGKDRVMNESWGAGGHDSGPADWLRIGRYLCVHGVNHFVPHHALATLRGTRKQDHPPFFSDQSSWFEYLRPLNDELTWLSWFSVQGRSANRILLLDALTTGYCRARKADTLDSTTESGNYFEMSLASVQELRQGIEAFAQKLSERLFDFDIGDEYILEESSQVQDGALRIGAQSYTVLLWPPGMTNLRRATAQILDKFIDTGGILIGIRPRAITIDGRPSDKLSRWEMKRPGQLRWFTRTNSLFDALAEMVLPRLRFSQASSVGLASLYRELPDGGALFILVNSHPTEPFVSVPHLERAYKKLVCFDPRKGVAVSLPQGESLTIPATECRILCVDATLPLTLADNVSCRELSRSLPLEFCGAERCGSNVCVIDYCELQIPPHPAEGLQLVGLANQRYWEVHGVPGNGWSGRVQLGHSLLERDACYSSASGGRILYQVNIEQPVDLENLCLAVECPQLWTITVNDHPVSFVGALPWRDPRLLSIPVGRYLNHGINTIMLQGQPFQTRQEIDAIYLLGDFSVSPAKQAFVISGVPRPMCLGSWKSQGLPFFDGAVDYRFRIPSFKGIGKLVLSSEAWLGSVMELRHGDYREVVYGPGVELDIDPARGDELVLRVIGFPKNLWGPWHVPSKPRKQGWNGFWAMDKQTGKLLHSGESYDLLDMGILTEELSIRVP